MTGDHDNMRSEFQSMEATQCIFTQSTIFSRFRAAGIVYSTFTETRASSSAVSTWLPSYFMYQLVGYSPFRKRAHGINIDWCIVHT